MEIESIRQATPLIPIRLTAISACPIMAEMKKELSNNKPAQS
jgi:hypothetical protein